jgi:CheY-like chemotaxis protein
MAVLIVAPRSVEASLLSLRLMRWGARTCVVPDEAVAAALLPERAWDAVIVDQTLGLPAMTRLLAAAPDLRRRIVLITPATRHELPALRDAGFTSYLVKPVRAASLAARLTGATDAFGLGTLTPVGPDTAIGAASAAPGLTILVAEDNEINALLARALLAKLGHRPSVATNGAAAVDSWLAARAAGTPYDLVLMDVHMPGTDGLEATRRIRAEEESSGHTPILAVTANAFAEDREACLAAGMDGFLVKPLDPDRLAAALAAVPLRAPLAA